MRALQVSLSVTGHSTAQTDVVSYIEAAGSSTTAIFKYGRKYGGISERIEWLWAQHILRLGDYSVWGLGRVAKLLRRGLPGAGGRGLRVARRG
jgi:hypothetical protein